MFIYMHILSEIPDVKTQTIVYKQVSKNHVVPFGTPLVSRWYPDGIPVVPGWFRLVSRRYPFGYRSAAFCEGRSCFNKPGYGYVI